LILNVVSPTKHLARTPQLQTQNVLLHPAKQPPSVISGELCPPRISDRVEIDPPGKLGVVLKVWHVWD
jgi:hypothetical protein